MIDQLDHKALTKAGVIGWGAPVLSFGDLSLAQVATVGLNPSNREFMDEAGSELEGKHRRFHTLGSLGLDDWCEVDTRHLRLILDSYRRYFTCNPYENWFRRLDLILSATEFSFFSSTSVACHVDLIPYATARKWSELSIQQRASLLLVAGDMLALLIRKSPIRVLILNGRSVVENFEKLAARRLSSKIMSEWSLPRRDSAGVAGIAYKGMIDEISGVSLSRPVLVLGYNHNIQSSFGVTGEVIGGIRAWVAEELRVYL